MRFSAGPEPHFRASAHLFVDRDKPSGRRRAAGVHLKLRRNAIWDHAAFKTRLRRNMYGEGQVKGLDIWIGRWRTAHGVRGPISGARLRIQFDPYTKINLEEHNHNPLAPSRPRSRDEPFEVL